MKSTVRVKIEESDKLKGLLKSCATKYKIEGGIEKTVPRIIDWQHEAIQVMTIGDRERRGFLSHPHTNNGFFSCSPLNTRFILEKQGKCFQKILNTLRCDMVTSF